MSCKFDPSRFLNWILIRWNILCLMWKKIFIPSKYWIHSNRSHGIENWWSFLKRKVHGLCLVESRMPNERCPGPKPIYCLPLFFFFTQIFQHIRFVTKTSSKQMYFSKKICLTSAASSQALQGSRRSRMGSDRMAIDKVTWYRFAFLHRAGWMTRTSWVFFVYGKVKGKSKLDRNDFDALHVKFSCASFDASFLLFRILLFVEFYFLLSPAVVL